MGSKVKINLTELDIHQRSVRHGDHLDLQLLTASVLQKVVEETVSGLHPFLAVAQLGILLPLAKLVVLGNSFDGLSDHFILGRQLERGDILHLFESYFLWAINPNCVVGESITVYPLSLG